MLIRIFPNRDDLLILQNICDKKGVPLLCGAGLPEIYGTLDGFNNHRDGSVRPENYKWMTAYLDVEHEEQAISIRAEIQQIAWDNDPFRG